IRVDAEGHRWQQHDPGTSPVGALAGAAGEQLDLEGVGAVGHVEVVRLGGPEGQDGDFPLLRADEGMRLVRQDTFPHVHHPAFNKIHWVGPYPFLIITNLPGNRRILMTAIPPSIPLDDPSLYINRELSWLEFNRRVLEEAQDSSVPL